MSALLEKHDRETYLDFRLQGRNVFRGNHLQNPSAAQVLESHRCVDFNLIGACDVDARWGRFWGPSRAALSLEMPRSPGFREEARESRQASGELLSL